MKDNDIFIKFKQQYSLSLPIPLTVIPKEIFNVDSIIIEFITENNCIIEFSLVLEKKLKLIEDETKLDHFSKFLTHLIIQSKLNR